MALFGLPYGDQAIFVRRDVFEAIGGYADLPIMEDVDLVRRLQPARAPLPLAAAGDDLGAALGARRLDRVGRRATSLLILLYFCGVPPARLIRLDPARRAHPDPSGRAYVLIMKADSSGVTGAARLASKG